MGLADLDNVRSGRAAGFLKRDPLTTRAKVLEGDPVEALLDRAREVREDSVGDVGGARAPLLLALVAGEHDRAFDRAEDVAELHFIRLFGEQKPAAWSALRLDEVRPLQELEDLLEEPQRDLLARGDVLHLHRRLRMNGEIEDRLQGVATAVREAKHGGTDQESNCRIGKLKYLGQLNKIT